MVTRSPRSARKLLFLVSEALSRYKINTYGAKLVDKVLGKSSLSSSLEAALTQDGKIRDSASITGNDPGSFHSFREIDIASKSTLSLKAVEAVVRSGRSREILKPVFWIEGSGLTSTQPLMGKTD